jgi:hypothetical protein
MPMMDDKNHIEYAALMNEARDAERMTFVSWMSAGIAAAALLAWGIGSRQPGFMLPVVAVAAAGFLAMLRWRERAALVTGYIETYHESEHGSPSFFTRLNRLYATQGGGAARDWHIATFFNVIVVAAAVFAWMESANTSHGELWAGVVTGCGLAFASYSLSETARTQHMDAGALWRRSEGRLTEVKRQSVS